MRGIRSKSEIYWRYGDEADENGVAERKRGGGGL